MSQQQSNSSSVLRSIPWPVFLTASVILQNYMTPHLQDSSDGSLTVQQDGVRPGFYTVARAYQDAIFNGEWIGGAGPDTFVFVKDVL